MRVILLSYRLNGKNRTRLSGSYFKIRMNMTIGFMSKRFIMSWCKLGDINLDQFRVTKNTY